MWTEETSWAMREMEGKEGVEPRWWVWGILGDGMGVPQQDRLTDRPLIALPVFSSLR